MRTKIIKIGNSQGIRIPKILIEESGLRGDVEISVKQNTLVIEPLRHPRENWEEAFREMSENRDDALLDGDSPVESAFDNSEWEW